MQASLGRILGSGPSNVAVDNFASRLHRVTYSVCARYNKGKRQDDLTRQRHVLIARGYNPKDEMDAAIRILQKPELGTATPSSQEWSANTPWQPHLSLATWVLAILRSPSISPLHSDDKAELLTLRARIDADPRWGSLRAVATLKTPWEEFEGKDQLKEQLGFLFAAIIGHADILCLTPSASEIEQYREWKNEKAKGVAVDEAANLSRPDLYTVWGNTLLPCLLAGDSKQLPPTVLSANKTDADGNLLHRHVGDSRLSGLEFLQASGIPVYRLRVQLRMANGLFDSVAQTVYPEVPLQYADSCNISLPQFVAGRALEGYFRKIAPSIRQPPHAKLRPIFIHCEDSKVFVDELTGSKKSPDQVRVALQLAFNLVQEAGVKAEDIILLTPYAANVSLIQWMRTAEAKCAEVLAKMAPASTVDGYQGQEKPIVIVVMGTGELLFLLSSLLQGKYCAQRSNC